MSSVSNILRENPEFIDSSSRIAAQAVNDLFINPQKRRPFIDFAYFDVLNKIVFGKVGEKGGSFLEKKFLGNNNYEYLKKYGKSIGIKIRKGTLPLGKTNFRLPQIIPPKISLVGRLAGPLGIIFGEYGSFALKRLINKDYNDKAKMAKELKSVRGSTIGALVGLGIGSLFGPVGGYIGSLVGGEIGKLAAENIDFGKMKKALYLSMENIGKGNTLRANYQQLSARTSIAKVKNALYSSMENIGKGNILRANYQQLSARSTIAKIKNALESSMNNIGEGYYTCSKYSGYSHSIGIPRVPYDNYPALLHEGESVLTKRETNNLRSGYGSISIAKLSDTIIVREVADIDRIAGALVSKIKLTALNMA
ncbi:hypothetical protein LPY66_16070 [Dehalobacter sp. DCM]|uniref:hypothetical protein n=1 Tax=Dehalobacter sp. DCM TaxID=2907827 RepID=UPI0030820C50|nr:hypothetical protein LPY66_16070 [Dehalobacter sp. DCM]